MGPPGRRSRPAGADPRAAAVAIEADRAAEDSTGCSAPQPIDFLRRRLAAAILTGDDETADGLVAKLDRLLNGGGS